MDYYLILSGGNLRTEDDDGGYGLIALGLCPLNVESSEGSAFSLNAIVLHSRPGAGMVSLCTRRSFFVLLLLSSLCSFLFCVHIIPYIHF